MKLKKDIARYALCAGAPSARWRTEDQRFEVFIFADMSDDHPPRRWQISAGTKATHDDIKLLYSTGLVDARFDTRRDALQALEEALKG
jgi:hypothetical protein